MEVELNPVQFQSQLLTWYNQVKRDLPWRKNTNPYYILVSETMLQQTQVVTVIPYFERFIATFPTPEALAIASEPAILKAWEGLGYYSRVRNLQKAAQMIVALGYFPSTHSEILALKGVGPYTAGAIASIAFSLPTPAVDGNVFRVISRVCGIFEDIMKAKTRKIFEEVVRELIPIKAPGDFNQGLMELGATVCKPTSPNCVQCPVQAQCVAYEKDWVPQLPVKTRPVKQKVVHLAVALLENAHGEFFISKRPSTGLLANFYEFIQYENPEQLDPEDFLRRQLTQAGYTIETLSPLVPTHHIFTHLRWELAGFHVTVSQVPPLDLDKHQHWVKLEALSIYSVAVAHLKLLEQWYDMQQPRLLL